MVKFGNILLIFFFFFFTNTGSSEFEFFVEGRDKGKKSLHSNVAVLLRIVGVDVKPPEFLSRKYSLPVSEDTQPGLLFLFDCYV